MGDEFLGVRGSGVGCVGRFFRVDGVERSALDTVTYMVKKGFGILQICGILDHLVRVREGVDG